MLIFYKILFVIFIIIVIVIVIYSIYYIINQYHLNYKYLFCYIKKDKH